MVRYEKILNNILTLLVSTVIAFLLMKMFLGEFISRLIPYANAMFGYSLFICIILLISTLINIVIYYLKYKKFHISKYTFGIFIISYTALLISVLFSRNSLGNHYTSNYIPFKTILWFLSSKTDLIYKFSNLIGNIVIFIPLGAILYYLLHKYMKISRCLFISTLLIILLESLQKLYVVGSFDIDDVLLNSIGVVLGIRLVMKKMNIKEYKSLINKKSK